jgi:hypothetical protein
VGLLLWDQREQIIPERLKRQMHLSVFGGQGGQRLEFHPATGLADRLRHAINDVVGPDPNIVMHLSLAHGAGQRYEEGHCGLRIRYLHARIVQCSILYCAKASLAGLTPVQALRRGLVASVMTAAHGYLER